MLQGVLTCGYISLLSSFGERLAARIRCRLFAAVIVQDIAFFDANKTGEIVNRRVMTTLIFLHSRMTSFSAVLCSLPVQILAPLLNIMTDADSLASVKSRLKIYLFHQIFKPTCS